MLGYTDRSLLHWLTLGSVRPTPDSTDRTDRRPPTVVADIIRLKEFRSDRPILFPTSRAAELRLPTHRRPRGATDARLPQCARPVDGVPESSPDIPQPNTDVRSVGSPKRCTTAMGCCPDKDLRRGRPGDIVLPWAWVNPSDLTAPR